MNKKNKEVVKSNELIKASYALDLVEQRLIALAIYEARESQRGLKADEHLIIKPTLYADIFGVTVDAAYKALKDAASKLFKRQVTFGDNYKGIARTRTTRWVSEVAYLENIAQLQLIFAPAIVEEITRLESQFTKYYLNMTINFQSQYTYRLYELIKQWNPDVVKDIPIFPLQKLREQFGLEENEYSRLDNFKKKVLDKSVQEINENTDIFVSYNPVKEGRTVIGFRFTSEPNPKHTKPRLKDVTPVLDTSRKEQFTPSWHQRGLSEAQINKLAVHKKDFIDANTSKISPNDRRDYPDIFNDWRILLRDPEKAVTFNKVQEILER